MKLIFLSFIFMLSSFMTAQNPYHINYTIDDGLPTNTVYSIFKDDNGILWFATDVGVVKYDSRNFTLINTNDGLTDNEVFNIRQDDKKRKWLLTLNGTPTLIVKDRVLNDETSPIVQSLKSKGMHIDFYQDKNQNIYFASKKGQVFRIDKQNNVTSINVTPPSLYGVWKTNDTLFALTTKGIYNCSTQKITFPLFKEYSYRVYHNKQDTYFSNHDILYRITAQNTPKQLFKIPQDTEIINLYNENSNTKWVCTRNGLFLYKNNILKQHYFKNKSISSITKDAEHNYWVSTLHHGVLFIPSFNIKSVDLKINCIAKNNQNELWLGGYENDYYLKKENRFLKHTFISDRAADKIMQIRFFDSIRYVVGKSGLIKYSKNKFSKYYLGTNDILVQNKTLFIASDYLVKIRNSLFEKKDFSKLYENNLFNRRSNVLATDLRNHIYFGTNSGLYVYTKKQNIINLGKHQKLLKTSIEDLVFDDQYNNLLIATNSKGISILKNDSLVQSFSKKDGLNSNSCSSIAKINKDNYLIGSNNGLNLLQQQGETYTIKNFNTLLGFKNKKINDIEILNDTVYVATNNELIHFNYNYLKAQKRKPTCIINTLKAGSKYFTVNEQQQIPYQNNNISIQYTGISYIDQGDITYHYKLNESDKNWSTAKEHRINYNALPPKTYTFSIYCVNGFGEKSDIQTITFTIIKPYWMQWWFIVLCILLGVGLLLMAWKYRIQYLNKQFAKERKSILLEKENIQLENLALDLEQKALRLQMNPHFIFNALNSIKGYYAIGKSNEADLYITKFSKLLRLLLENETQTTSLAQEIEMLRLYLDLTQTRYTGKFDYAISIADAIDLNNTAIPFLILQPLVENAIIHGLAPKSDKGSLNISFAIENEQLICCIEDDGIGRKAAGLILKSTSHQSKALQITTDRLHLFDSTSKLIYTDVFANKQETGTRVVLKMNYKTIW